MSLQHDRAARRLVTAARLHADIAVFNDVESADAVSAADLVQLRQYLRRRHFFAIDARNVAVLVRELDDLSLVRRLFGRDRHTPHRFLGREIRAFQHAAFVADVQQVRVHRVGRCAGVAN